MGIPHLSHQLQPHGTKLVLARVAPDSKEQVSTIIDGPSLAYQCFYICMSRRSAARNAYEAAPSYRELGEAAVQWLQQIEQFGLQVYVRHRVHIDPNRTAEVEEGLSTLSRLQNYTNQLVSFRASSKGDLPSRLPSTFVGAQDLLSNASPSVRLKALPAPPFLVPAIIEALLTSKYKAITSVIPGEADAYCAHFARKHGGIILTSDSDLLVHDLGEAGRVILFKDIDSIHLPSKGKCLKVQQYQPFAIAAKLGLPNLVSLAYFMSEDNHCTFADATKLAKERHAGTREFTDFREQYDSLPILSSLAVEYLSASKRPVFGLLSQLDPRISELVHQIIMKQTCSAGEGRTLDMYLPFLIDDPTRTSAWRAGSSIRTLAYSLLQALDPGIAHIHEYERKGTRVAYTALPLCSINDAPTRIKQVMEDFGGTPSLVSQIGRRPITEWRLRAARSVTLSNLENGKATSTASDLVRLVTSNREGVLSWTYIHTSAQLQAVLYSFRLLLQVTRVVLAFSNEPPREGLHIPILEGLVAMLGDLPSLTELLDETSQPTVDETASMKSVIAEMLQSLGAPEDTFKTTSSKQKKKRKKKEEHASETTPPAWRQNNMFGSLA